MISARSVTKLYGRTPALTDVTLDVERGECLGITGSAGSGRTTLLRILGTLVPPTTGSVEIGGIDAATDLFSVRAQIGYVAPNCLVGDGLRVDEYLYFLAQAKGKTTNPAARGEIARRVSAAVARARLKPDTPVEKLAPHSRAALALAGALVGSPTVLLLDNAFGELEAAARPTFFEWVSEARQLGAAVVLATSEPAELELLCQRVLKLESGRILEELH